MHILTLPTVFSDSLPLSTVCSSEPKGSQGL